MKAKQVVGCIMLRDGRYVLKRQTGVKQIMVNNNWKRGKSVGPLYDGHKTIPGTPVFDTLEQAQEYREKNTGWFTRNY